MGRITRSPPKPRPKLTHEATVSRTGIKWETHQTALWTEVARIAGNVGYKQRRPFWAITAVSVRGSAGAAASLSGRGSPSALGPPVVCASRHPR